MCVVLHLNSWDYAVSAVLVWSLMDNPKEQCMCKEEFLETVILFFCSVYHAFDYRHSFGQIGKVRLTDPNISGFSTPNIMQQRNSKFTIMLDVKLFV